MDQEEIDENSSCNQNDSLEHPLSPIVEMDEYSVIGSTVSGELDETNRLSLDEDPLKNSESVQICTNISTDSTSIQKSETPPEELRKRLRSLQSEFEYLNSEHEELMEYTQLERQILHSECIPKCKDQEKTNKNANHFNNDCGDSSGFSLSTIELDDMSICQAKMSEEPDTRAKISINMGSSRNTHSVKMCTADFKESVYPAEKPGTPPEELRKRLTNIQSQFDYLVCEHEELVEFTKLEKQVHHSECIPINKVKALEDDFASLKKQVKYLMEENLYLKNKLFDGEKIMFETNQSQDGMLRGLEVESHLILNEDVKTQFQDTVGLNESQQINGVMSLGELPNEIASCQNFAETLNEEKCIYIFDQVQKHVESWDHTAKFEDFFNILREDEKLLLSVLEVMGDDTQKVFFKTMNKIKIRLNIYDETNYKLHLTIKELNGRIERIENENKRLKIIVNEIHHEVKEELFNRVAKLENIINTNQDVENNFKKKITDMDSEIKKLVEALSHSENKLKETCDLLETVNSENSKLLSEVTNNRDSVKIYNVHEEIYSILHELDKIFDSWDDKKSSRDLFDKIQRSETHSLCVNVLENSETLDIFYKVLNKIEATLNVYSAENQHLQFTVETCKKSIKYFENEINVLKNTVKILDNQVKNDLVNRITNLEGNLNITDGEKVDLQGKCVKGHEDKNMALHVLEKNQKQNVHLSKMSDNDELKLLKDVKNIVILDDLKNELEYIVNEFENSTFTLDSNNRLNIISENKNLLLCNNLILNPKIQLVLFNVFEKFTNKLNFCEAKNINFQMTIDKLNNCLQHFETERTSLMKIIKDLEFENKLLNDKNIDNNYQKQNCMNECSKQLEKLRKLMSLEITCLDNDENKENLLNLPSDEIFSKLMQNIIRKESEISLDLQKQFRKDIDRIQEKFEKVNNKLKSKESWILELESDNEKMGKELIDMKQMNSELTSKLKILLNDLRNTSSENYELKTRVSELTEKNYILNEDLHLLSESIKSQNTSNQILQNNIEKLKEELVENKSIIADLNYQLPCVISENNASLSSKEKISYESYAVEKSDLSQSDIFVSLEGHKSITGSTHIENSCQLKNKLNELDKEKTQVLQFLLSSRYNLNFIEHLFTYSEDYFILKDILQAFANKIIEIEAYYAKSVSHSKDNFDEIAKDINELKLNITNLYKELESDNNKREIYSSISHNANIIDHDDLVSLKQELELVKEECLNFTNCSNKFEQSVKKGQNVITDLKQEIRLIKKVFDKSFLIKKDLHKTIELEQYKNMKKNIELEKLLEQENSLRTRNTVLEDHIRDLNSKISDIMSMFSELEIDFPVQCKDIGDKLHYLNQVLKNNIENKHLIRSLSADVIFFSVQFNLMSSYINDIDCSLVLAQDHNEKLFDECNALKKQLTCTNKQLDESNLILSQLISKAPIEFTSSIEAVQAIHHIFAQYSYLKDNEVTSFQEVQLKQGIILQQHKEIESLKILNSGLKSELANCQESVCNLRSELRVIRRQYQKRENGYNRQNKTVNKAETEKGVQTEHSLCCKELQKYIVDLEKQLKERCHQITELTLLVKNEDFVYKRKVNELEQTLTHAKEKIKTLNLELIEQKNYRKDLLEYYNSQKYQEKLDQADKEIETLKNVIANQRTNSTFLSSPDKKL